MTDIRSLADHLKISIGTVSRALNNRPGVNPETRARVLEAALELGYVANQSGRALRRGSTNTVGFLVETGNPSNQSGDNFPFVVVDAMNAVLTARGYDLVMLPCHSADDPTEYLARLVARGTVDALILTATRRQDQRIALLNRTKMPFLTLGRSETPGNYPWFDLDFEGVARASVAHLVAQGHRRIAVSLPNSDATLGMYFHKGYLAGLAEHGITPDPALALRVEPSENGGMALGHWLLSQEDRPTAVLLCSEITAIGLYASLAGSPLRPGKELSVIAFRENPQMRFLEPRLACFRLSLSDLGAALGTAIIAMLEAEPGAPPPPARMKWPMDFVPGQSVARLESGA